MKKKPCQECLSVYGEIMENVREYILKTGKVVEEIGVDNIDLEEMVLIDIREEKEIASGIIPAKTLLTIPKNKIEISVDKILPFVDREIVCYCYKGVLSALSVKFLNDIGIKAKNLKGGIDAWVKSGKPIKNYLGVFVEAKNNF